MLLAIIVALKYQVFGKKVEQSKHGTGGLAMAEYIDRGIAIAKLTALEVTDRNATMTSAKRSLADMPAADVAPVVRCKDCKWGKTWKNAFGIEGFKCDMLCVDLSPEAFCSYGEREEGADDGGVYRTRRNP